MVELRATLTASGVCYLPKEIRSGFGRHLRILSNACSAVVFPDNVDYEDVLGSLAVITADIRHRMSLQAKREQKEAREK